MSTFRIGKCIIPLLLILLSAACTKQNLSVDLDDIDEQVIREFYDNVLDTLIGEDYLYTIPNSDPFLMESVYIAEDLDPEDLRFFDQQISKFSYLRWENIITREHILTEEGYNATIGDNHNYDLFFETYGYYYMSSITVPLFTPDGTRVFVEHATHCGRVCGEARIIEWSRVKGKWVFRTAIASWTAR